MAVRKDDESSQAGPATREVIRNMKRLRAEQGVSLAGLSLKMSTFGTGWHPVIHPDSLSRLESGKRRVTVDEVEAIAEVLGVTPAELCGWTAPAVERPAETSTDTTVHAQTAQARAEVPHLSVDVSTFPELLQEAVRAEVMRQLQERDRG